MLYSTPINLYTTLPSRRSEEVVMSPVVSAISHVALRVRDLDSAIETATGLAGLSISE
jgi:hypothetical protein